MTVEEKSIRDLIIEALKENQKSSKELFEYCKKRLGKEIPRTTFYYHINKLLEENKIRIVKIINKERFFSLVKEKEKREEKIVQPLTEEDLNILEDLKRTGKIDYLLRFLLKLIEYRESALLNEEIQNAIEELFQMDLTAFSKKDLVWFGLTIEAITKNIIKNPGILSENTEFRELFDSFVKYLKDSLKMSLTENFQKKLRNSELLDYVIRLPEVFSKSLLKISLALRRKDLLEYVLDSYFGIEGAVATIGVEKVLNDLLPEIRKEKFAREIVIGKCRRILKEEGGWKSEKAFEILNKILFGQ